MVQPIYKDLDGLSVAKLINFLENPLSADPGSPATGLKWYNTTDNVFRYFDGTTTHTFATLEDIAALGELKGDHDASTGNVPTAAPGDDISKGDYWRVTVGGTITGIGGPTDVVEPGDVIFANSDGATAAADFFVVQANEDFTAFVNNETVALASLPANTATDVTPAALSSIGSYLITNAAGEDLTIGFDVVVDQGTPKITITSLVALANLSVIFQGRP